MITKKGMYRTEHLSHMDRLNLGCYGCGRCFVELKRKKNGRYQCFEQLYMNCSETEIHVGEIKPPACDSFIPKNGPYGVWYDKDADNEEQHTQESDT